MEIQHIYRYGHALQSTPVQPSWMWLLRSAHTHTLTVLSVHSVQYSSGICSSAYWLADWISRYAKTTVLDMVTARCAEKPNGFSLCLLLVHLIQYLIKRNMHIECWNPLDRPKKRNAALSSN